MNATDYIQREVDACILGKSEVLGLFGYSASAYQLVELPLHLSMFFNIWKMCEARVLVLSHSLVCCVAHYILCGPLLLCLNRPVCFLPCRRVPLLWNSVWFPWQGHCIHKVPWADTGPPLHQIWHFRTLLAQWLVMFLFCLFWLCFWKN